MSETRSGNGNAMRQVFTIVDRAGKSFWIRIGAAFTNRDGSETVLLDALPTNGKLQIRAVEPRREPPREDSE